MARYSKIHVVNKLQAAGLTGWLYKAGIINSKALCYANAYNYLNALEKTGRPRAEAIKLTAAKFKLTRRTIYNVVCDMEEVQDLPHAVENLLSKLDA